MTEVPVRRGKLVLMGILVLVFSVGVTLALAELALRLFYPIRATIYQLDDGVLHSLCPGSRKMFEHHPLNGGKRIWVEVNRDGYRG